jgi:3-methylcrotonyl-CoA carboxylase alpha subunit
MIAKIVAHGDDRATALGRLERALRVAEVVGVATNREFLAAIAAHPAFREGGVDTGFIDAHLDALTAHAAVPVVDALALAAFAELEARAAAPSRQAGDPYSPWDRIDAWRHFGRGRTRLRYRDGEKLVTVRAMTGEGHYRLGLPDRRIRVSGSVAADGAIRLLIDGSRRIGGRVVADGDARHVLSDGRERRLVLEDPDAGAPAREAGACLLTAPLPATVTAVHVEAGRKVLRGEALVVLEAMKMEHVIAAPRDGTVAQVHFRAGDQVEEGAELITFEER